MSDRNAEGMNKLRDNYKCCVQGCTEGTLDMRTDLGWGMARGASYCPEHWHQLRLVEATKDAMPEETLIRIADALEKLVTVLSPTSGAPLSNSERRQANENPDVSTPDWRCWRKHDPNKFYAWRANGRQYCQECERIYGVGKTEDV